MRSCVVCILVCGFVGCGSHVRLKGTPVSVAGKVSQNGRPVGGLVMIFQPLGDGHMREFPIQKDGSFKGEMISGEYAYFVSKRTGASVGQVPTKLAPQYFEADLSRTVTVEPDKLLAVALD